MKLHLDILKLVWTLTNKEELWLDNFGDYQNYKAVISQVKKGDPLEELIYLHFDELSALTDSEAFKEAEMTHEASEGFTRIDIEKYVDSETLAKIKAEAKARKEGKTSEEKTDVDIEK